MRARSEARNTTAFAVSETVAGTFRKLRLAILPINWSLVTFNLLASVHRVLNGPTVRVGSGTKADRSDACRTDFYGEVFRKGFNSAESRANGCRAFYVTTRRAACQEDDDT